MKVCVIGLGEVGFPTAAYIKRKGIEIWGYDKNPTAISRAKDRGFQKATTNWSTIPPSDIYVVCVTTRVQDNLPDHSAVFDVCEKISKKSNNIPLVSIESTIIPGTCRFIWETIFRKKIHLIHVPHRYWPKEPEAHGVKQLRVIGAINSISLDIGLGFYNEALGIPLHSVSSIEIAEICKVSENAFRYVQIAFAEELKIISESLGLSFNEVREACNTKWNVDLPEARDGIGGTCLPKDTKYLASLTKYTTLLKGALTTDDLYRKWVVQNTPLGQLATSSEKRQNI